MAIIEKDTEIQKKVARCQPGDIIEIIRLPDHVADQNCIFLASGGNNIAVYVGDKIILGDRIYKESRNTDWHKCSIEGEDHIYRICLNSVFQSGKIRIIRENWL